MKIKFLASLLGHNNLRNLQSFYYRSKNFSRSLSQIVQNNFHPVLQVGDVKICFNGKDAAFFHYLWGLDFLRIRRLFRRINPILGKLKPNIVLDVGANYGVFAILANSYYIDNAQVICVEPDSRCFSFLQLNLRMAKIRDCNAINAMVGSLGGGQEHEFRENSYGSLDSRGAGFEDLTTYKEASIPCYRLDELVTTYCHYLQSPEQRRLLVKIDTQGMDIDVLRSGEEALRSAAAAVVLIEIMPVSLLSSNAKSIFEIFRDIGFNQIANLGESNIEWNESELFPFKKLSDIEHFSGLWNKLLSIPNAYTNLLLIKGITE